MIKSKPIKVRCDGKLTAIPNTLEIQEPIHGQRKAYILSYFVEHGTERYMVRRAYKTMTQSEKEDFVLIEFEGKQ